MKIKDIMTTDVISVDPKTPVSAVSDMIFKNGIHGVPVVEGKKVIGIITEDDFFLKNYDALYLPSYLKFIQNNKLAASLPDEVKEKIVKLLNTQAEDIMTKDCVTVSPEMDVAEIMEIIKKTKFTTFPVTQSDNNLVGIVTLVDILGTVRRGSREMAKAFRGEHLREIDTLAKDVDFLWKDEFVLISKKKVRTWKGVLFITAVAAIGAIILLIVNTNLLGSFGSNSDNFSPLACQKFTYSDWNACQNDGTQNREIIDKMPKNCKGGTPELVRPCQ